jgi:hypothetical protein
VFGPLVHAYRTSKRGDTVKVLEGLKKDETDEDVVKGLEKMEVGAKVERAKEGVATAFSLPFVLVPINTILPVDAVTAQVAKTIAKAAVNTAVKEKEKRESQHQDQVQQQQQSQRINAPANQENLPYQENIISSQRSVHPTKESLYRDEKASASTALPEIGQSWGATKAFLMYLGYPQTDDPIYELWEPSRLKLKNLYGANPQDDLWKNKITSDMRKRVKDQMNNESINLSELDMSLLQVLWIVYECDKLPYYHRVFEKPNKPKERVKDERDVQRIIHPVSENVIRLDKCHVQMITNLLCQPKNAFGPENPFWDAVFPNQKETNPEKRLDEMKWFVTALTEYWLKKQEIWGYVDRTEDNRLYAVSFLEPEENSEASLSWLLFKERAKGFFKMGPSAYGHLVDKFNEAKEIRKHNPSSNSNVIHYFAINNTLPESEAENAATNLLNACCEYSREPTFAIIYKSNPAFSCFERSGFSQVDSKGDLLVMKRDGPGKYARFALAAKPPMQVQNK